MPPDPNKPAASPFAEIGDALTGFFDPDWYLSRYPDVAGSGIDPMTHFVTCGAAEGRDPNAFFDGAWYAMHYPDIGSSGYVPLLHYLQVGASELRNPHPRFDAAYYADEHPEAAGNPLLYHMLSGASRGWLTEKPVDISDYLPSGAASPVPPRGLVVDIVIPVYRGLEQTQRCLLSVFADRERPAGRVIVVDDQSPEPRLSQWLDRLAAGGRILLVRNRRNQGFVTSVNIGIKAAGTHDVVLLNSDTEVPQGWLTRLAGHAYATPRVASVSPFSNRATICGYPSIDSSPMAFGLGVTEIDSACRFVNGGRSVVLPTTVGFCMYIRRTALADVGLFDVQAFGKGYGEENDFCLRASERGWRHLLACDTFVYHEGSVSFGADASAAARQGMVALRARYPQYERLVAQHVKLDAAGPFRFALTTELFRRSNLPTVLMVTHDLGGGVRRHILDLVQKLAGKINCLLLESTTRGSAVSVPALPGHPDLALPAYRMDDLILVLQSAKVTRLHIHHLMSMDIDVRSLLHRLGVPFDVTVHDYFAICPQVNLLPWLQGAYCGEPDIGGCNACIADRPSYGARDIVSWRRANAWQFLQAERVICPSEDVRRRLARYGLDQRAVVVPHEPVAPGTWPMSPQPIGKSEALRVVVIGVLAHQKGALAVINVAMTADPADVSIRLIGYAERALLPAMPQTIEMTEEYHEADLPKLLAEQKPHVVWFPAQWPETYSYTLTAAINAGLPIVATRIGAFPERLEGRPLTWLADPEASAEQWIGIFADARRELTRRKKDAGTTLRPAVPDYYREDYLHMPAVRHAKTLIDLRRNGRLSIVVIPERFDNGTPTPCGYIRLLQPLDHPAIARDFDIVLADAEEALRYRADIFATQRYAVPELGSANDLIRHCRDHAITLLYDLDDDLLHIPRDHPDAKELRPRAKLVSRMVRGASSVWVSTRALADTLTSVRNDLRVVPNGLDERLWCASSPPSPRRQGPLRVLFMGTATHDADLALVEGALSRIHAVFNEHVSIDLLGVSRRSELPPWANRVPMSVHAATCYPAFVNWLTQQHFDIGIAPLADTPFNRCKSAIKALDYAALGLPVLASDRAVYRSSLADGIGGVLLPDDPGAWFVALSTLLRDGAARRRLGDAAKEAFAAGTLAAQASERRSAWLALASAVLAARHEAAAVG